MLVITIISIVVDWSHMRDGTLKRNDSEIIFGKINNPRGKPRGIQRKKAYF